MEIYLFTEYPTILNIEKVKACEGCGTEFRTNVNRSRCSLKCSKILKYQRAKINKLINKRIEIEEPEGE